MYKKSKKDRKIWWSSLTIDEQVEWRMSWEEQRGNIPNYDEIYTKTLKENNYLK